MAGLNERCNELSGSTKCGEDFDRGNISLPRSITIHARAHTQVFLGRGREVGGPTLGLCVNCVLFYKLGNCVIRIMSLDIPVT